MVMYVPEEAAGRLRSGASELAVMNQLRVRSSARALAILRAAGVEGLLVKGTALLAISPEYRPLRFQIGRAHV